MIPICDVIPARKLPILTIGLIAANCLLFIGLRLAGLGIPVLGSRDAGIATSAWWPLVLAAALFVNHNGLQLLMSMLYLWVFGGSVEARIGRVRFGLLYLACGLTAGIIHAWLRARGGDAFTGSTGAVTGVLGAYLVLYPRARVLAWIPLPVVLVEIPAAYFLVFWGALHTLDGLGALTQLRGNGLSGGLSGAAFAASLVAGGMLCLAFRRPVEWRA